MAFQNVTGMMCLIAWRSYERTGFYFNNLVKSHPAHRNMHHDVLAFPETADSHSVGRFKALTCLVPNNLVAISVEQNLTLKDRLAAVIVMHDPGARCPRPEGGHAYPPILNQGHKKAECIMPALLSRLQVDIIPLHCLIQVQGQPRTGLLMVLLLFPQPCGKIATVNVEYLVCQPLAGERPGQAPSCLF